MEKIKTWRGEETVMPRPITVTYDWLYNEPFVGRRESYTAETYEDYHRIVRILHENPDKYKVVSVHRPMII